ncbi:MAG: O-antigen ligase family protein [Geobacter sp.]|nr:O-antigen ligase family protein [Geobacter sp.]
MSTDLHGQAGLWEKAFAITALLLLSDAVIPLLRMESGFDFARSQGDPLMQTVYSGIYLVIALLTIRYRKTVFALVLREKFLACLLVMTWLSALWSDAPGITLRRGAALTGTTLFGMYLAVRYELREQMRLLAQALGLAAILSLLVALFLPAMGISRDIHEGSWRGIFVHKNILGQMMVLSSMVYLVLLAEGGKLLLCAFAGFAFSLGLLLLSTAKTSLLIFVALMALLALFKALRWHYYLRIFFFSALLVTGGSGIVWLIQNSGYALNALGRDPTLSGRTELWELVLDMILKRPLLGYGFSAFWMGLGSKSADVWDLAGWDASHAHNGILNLSLDLGLAGVLVFTLGFFASVRKALRTKYPMDAIEGLWPLVYLAFFLLFNLTESSILRQNNILWLLYAATVFSLFKKNDEVAW